MTFSTLGTMASYVPKQGVTGTVDLSTATVVKGAGMDLITPTSVAGSGVTLSGGQVTFTAATSVSVNGCFTSAYENYLVVFSADATSDMDVQFRLRASGTDNSSALYTYTVATFNGTYIGVAGATLFTIAPIDTPGQDTIPGSVQVFAPQLSKATSVFGTAIGSKSGVTGGTGYYLGGFHDSASVFDGFSLIPSASNITGTLRIYGLRNS